MLNDPSSPGSVAPAHVTGELWHLALEAAGIGAWEWDVAGAGMWWSRRATEIAGFDPDAAPGSVDDLLAIIDPDDRNRLQAALEDVRHNRPARRLEVRMLARPGAARWVEISAKANAASSGEAETVIGTVADISERKAAEQARERMLQEEQRARSEAETARERLEFLISAGSAIRAVLEPDAVRRAAVALVVEHLGDWGLILDPAGHVVEAGAGGSLPPGLGAGTLSLVDSHDVITQVLTTGEAQLATAPVRLLLAGEAGTEPVELQASSIIAVPLLLGSTTLGVMVAGHRRTGRPYGTEDLELFGRYAESLGGALTKATLFEERSAIARALQQSLLPSSLPDIAGIDIGTEYLPVGGGLVVGGDFYDVFRVSDGRYAFAIGDVSGKGSEAAAVTALVRHTIRAYCEVHEDPAEVLAAVNGAVLVHGPSQRYCTAVLGTFTADGSDILLAVGGHPLPLLARSGGSVEAVGTPGTLLGMFPEVGISTARVRLHLGDYLVLYTDGVTEARGRAVPFGEQRLAALLRSMPANGAQAIAADIGAAVAGYRDEPSDDVAVLVLRRVTPAA